MLKRKPYNQSKHQKPAERLQAAIEGAARRTLRHIERLQRTAAGAVRTTEWEEEFLIDVGQRLRKFGRAFVDSEKGDLSRPVSIRQSIKLGEIQRSIKRQSNRQTGSRNRS